VEKLEKHNPQNLENPLEIFDNHYGDEIEIVLRDSDVNGTMSIEGKLISYNLPLGLIIIENDDGLIVLPNRGVISHIKIKR
jgi:hypothetical protein